MENKTFIADTIDGKVEHSLCHVTGEEREEALKHFKMLDKDSQKLTERLAKGIKTEKSSKYNPKAASFYKRLEAACNGRYEIDHIKYTKVKDYYEPICPKHGSWSTMGHVLLRGSGCPTCYDEKR